MIQPLQKDITRCFDKIYDLKNSITFNKYTVYDENKIVTNNE